MVLKKQKTKTTYQKISNTSHKLDITDNPDLSFIIENQLKLISTSYSPNATGMENITRINLLTLKLDLNSFLKSPSLAGNYQK